MFCITKYHRRDPSRLLWTTALRAESLALVPRDIGMLHSILAAQDDFEPLGVRVRCRYDSLIYALSSYGFDIDTIPCRFIAVNSRRTICMCRHQRIIYFDLAERSTVSATPDSVLIKTDPESSSGAKARNAMPGCVKHRQEHQPPSSRPPP